MGRTAFTKASAVSSAGNINFTDFEGALCIFTKTGWKDEVRTKYTKDGEPGKPAAYVDVEVVAGVKNGTPTEKSPASRFAERKTLKDLTGQKFQNVQVMQGWPLSTFKGLEEGQQLLSRLVIEGKVTKQSTDETDLKEVWVLTDYTDADLDLVEAYEESKIKAQAKTAVSGMKTKSEVVNSAAREDDAAAEAELDLGKPGSGEAQVSFDDLLAT